MASCLGLSKPAAFDVFCLHLSVTNTQHELEDSPVTFAKLARVSAIVITLEKVNISYLGTDVSFFFPLAACLDYPAACYYNVYYLSHITIITAIMKKSTRDGEKHTHAH